MGGPQVRGPTYLKDRKKVPAGPPAFRLGAMEMVKLPAPGTAVGGAKEGTPGAWNVYGCAQVCGCA